MKKIGGWWEKVRMFKESKWTKPMEFWQALVMDNSAIWIRDGLVQSAYNAEWTREWKRMEKINSWDKKVK